MSARVLLIDNYDSFTYNLVQAFLVLGAEVEVHRNDQLSVAEAAEKEFSHLVISPGPGRRSGFPGSAVSPLPGRQSPPRSAERPGSRTRS